MTSTESPHDEHQYLIVGIVRYTFAELQTPFCEFLTSINLAGYIQAFTTQNIYTVADVIFLSDMEYLELVYLHSDLKAGPAMRIRLALSMPRMRLGLFMPTSAPSCSIFKWLLRVRPQTDICAIKFIYDNLISEGYTSIDDLVNGPPDRSKWVDLGCPPQHLDSIVAALQHLEYSHDLDAELPELVHDVALQHHNWPQYLPDLVNDHISVAALQNLEYSSDDELPELDQFSDGSSVFTITDDSDDDIIWVD